MQFRLIAAFLLFSVAVSAQNLNNTLRAKRTWPGQTLANVWGYVADGKEYALVGGSKGLIILDITNPDNPLQIVQLPGPDNLWKEIKTYQNYAYVVSEGGNGIQIVNLSNLPASNLPWKYYRGDGAIQNQLNALHALHIDETKGFLYAWGGPLFGGGAKIFDLKPDPYNPVYVGKFDQLGYIHDGYVDNDTMYSGHIYAGQFAIVNMANKSVPELINTQTTPGAFTHNTWLTDDRKTILATDEVNNSYLSAWDVSDPTDIKLLDRIQSNPGSGSMVHNTYVRGNWALTSWYKDGFTIVDITRPDNLVQVGNYDTYPGQGGGSEGCWGVYHNFPSGNIIASNIDVGGAGELFIITPNYVRACYLEGRVRNGIDSLPIQNVLVKIVGAAPNVQELTTPAGIFKTGLATGGYYTVQVTKNGYEPYETSVYMQAGELIQLDVMLYPLGTLTVNGVVTNNADASPAPDASVWLFGNQQIYTATTDGAGTFTVNSVQPGVYDVAVSATDMSHGILSGVVITTDTSLALQLFPTYRRKALRERAETTAFQWLENPFAESTQLVYEGWSEQMELRVVNAAGQVIQIFRPGNASGVLRLGENWPSGMYQVFIMEKGDLHAVKRLVKIP
ncbi:MAG: choice-of-anchor B family protein [Saprospiraceae bacterium]|nr:choice-of-anchor B family protein [Saprospiraceae bacterium]